MIMIVLLCKVLVEIYDKDKQKTQSILNHISKTKSGNKKQVCINHYERIMSEDFKGACKDCSLLE